MPIDFTDNYENPPENSLVVCAGTVTCRTVQDMGSGFLLFKKIFKSNISCNNFQGGWQAQLQQSIDNHLHVHEKSMPPYMRIAQQDSFIGGVATVPVYAENNPRLEIDYKTAVAQAILDAKELKKHLFLQPLGIGVYSWPPEKASTLFFQAIREADPNNEVSITIPLYEKTTNSKDQQFKNALSLLIKTSVPNNIPNDKHILPNIIRALIQKIETQQGTRWTSGKGSEKVKKLQHILQHISEDTDLEIKMPKYLQDIMTVCQIKRNPLHFWSSPHSVHEYLALLKENNIEFLPDNTSGARYD